MAIEAWLLVIGLGALCGLLGQSMRVIIGIYKATEEENYSFNFPRLVVSILIGALAGAVAAIAFVPFSTSIGVDQVLALLAAGYAGADFIEGFIGKYLPKN